MAKLRSVNTHFWDDEFVSNLHPNEKLLFLYLLTNSLTNVAGVYEITDRRIAFDTGLGTQAINAGFSVMEKAGKVKRVGSWLILVNHHKNQKMNPSMEQARKSILAALPKEVVTAYEQGVPTLPSSSTKVKDEVKTEVKAKGIDDRIEEFRQQVFSSDCKFSQTTCAAFFDYWSEKTRNGTKMRCELQPTWDLPKRLATWQSREVSGKKQGNSNDRLYRE